MKISIRRSVCALALTAVSWAQDTTPVASNPEITAQPQKPVPTSGSEDGYLSRWLSVSALSFTYRWRDMADSDGFHLFDSGQERALATGGLKLDSAGKYQIKFHVSTGRNFNWAYSDSLGDGFWELITPSRARQSKAQLLRKALANAADPVGAAAYNRVSRGAEVYVRQLYFSATPLKQFTLEYGGLPIERGLNTEITSYDDDGFMVGERLRLHDPRHLFFDQLAVTYGYMGDYFVPNFFDRGHRLGQSNYHQIQVQKNFGSRLKGSADYTWVNGVDTLREAALVQTPEIKLFDSTRVELYQRVNDITLQKATFQKSSGFAFTGSRTFFKKVQLEGGYASVDQHYTVIAGSRALDAVAFSFNGDSFGIGRRVFARSNIRLNPYLLLFGFYTHQVATDYYNKSREGMNFGMTIDFKNLLNDKFHLGIVPSASKN